MQNCYLGNRDRGDSSEVADTRFRVCPPRYTSRRCQGDPPGGWKVLHRQLMRKREREREIEIESISFGSCVMKVGK